MRYIQTKEGGKKFFECAVFIDLDLAIVPFSTRDSELRSTQHAFTLYVVYFHLSPVTCTHRRINSVEKIKDPDSQPRLIAIRHRRHRKIAIPNAFLQR